MKAYGPPIVVGALGVALSSGCAAWSVTAALSAAEASLRDTAKLTALAAGPTLASLQVASTIVALEVEAADAIQPQSKALRSVQVALPALRAIAVVNADGVVRATSLADGRSVGMDVSDRAYFRGAVAAPSDRLLLSPTIVSRMDARRIMPMSRAVLDEAGRVTAVVATFTLEERVSSPRLEAIMSGGAQACLDGPDRDVLNALGGAAPRRRPPRCKRRWPPATAGRTTPRSR